MERRSEGAEYCGELRARRHGVLCGAAAWVDAAAVVHLATARPKSQVVGVDLVEEAGSDVDQAVAILEARTDIRIMFTD